jgi:hypothetical protein
VTFTIWQADQNSFGSYCVRVLARLQQWRRTHPNSRLADLFGVGATANPETRALGLCENFEAPDDEARSTRSDRDA